MAHQISSSPYKIPQPVKVIFGLFVVVGLATFAAALQSHSDRLWPNFLLNYFFFLVLGLFGAFFTALQHITNAYWSVTVRRVAESLITYLPVAFVLGLVLIFLGGHHLYEWTHKDVVAHDHLLSLKSAYLNTPFMVIRFFVFMAIWIGLGMKMRSNSIKQDATGDAKFTVMNMKLSAVFLPLFAISFSLMMFDLLMSLEPHWFSTIFGVYGFAGLFFSGMALMAILCVFGKKQGVFSDEVINANHLHDIGKLMFAFTVFWAYIFFSQFMLQWYANLPEEISYYIRRKENGWFNVGALLLTVHFVLPFFLLLPRGVKRCQTRLPLIALLMLAAQWLDCYYMVMPVFFGKGPVFGWVEVGMALGFLGIFGIVVGRALEKSPALAYSDPRLEQCLHHAQ